VCVVLVAVVVLRVHGSSGSAPTLERAVITAMEAEGVRVREASLTWVDGRPSPFSTRGLLFLGAVEGGLADLYYAEIRAAGGTVLAASSPTNVSDTAGAEEHQIARVGDFVAVSALVGDRLDAVSVLDLRGEPASLTAGWSARQRLQNGVSNLQQVGRARGFGVRRYQWLERPASYELRPRRGGFVVTHGADARDVELDPGREEPREGAQFVEVQSQTKGVPGTVAWVVDTVRAVPWIGPEPIEWLENRAFAVRDRLQQGWHGVVGPDDTAAEAAADLGTAGSSESRRRALLTATDPELGWPPPPVAPVLPDVVEGEGRWLPVVDDPYVNAYPGAPPAFYQTFIRSDPQRDYTRVYITMWDPRQVQLRMVAGAFEPVSATGQRGPGMVPRDERTLRNLVGAFNGGFQALHGEFGMMADGQVYLPPKPWAATVAVFDDGRVGMGSWPAPDWNGRFVERFATRQIPEGMVEYRQNLTSVVEDGRWNPWERWYWGAAPRGAQEQTLTGRTGLCLTEEGFMAYFWGQNLSPEALATAMLGTRCRRGLHLDMNSAHCGFEFFRPIAPGEQVPRLSQAPDAAFEHEGPLSEAPGWTFRARRAVRSMEMPFPRYSGNEGRDFFYLTLRPVLPGPAIAVASPGEGEGEFRTDGLPHAGWPHAFARTYLGPDEQHRTWFLRIDPRRAVPGPAALAAHHRRPLAYLTNVRSTDPGPNEVALVARHATVGTEYQVGRPAEGDRVVLSGPALSRTPDAIAALGVDRDGFLVYAERSRDATDLRARMASAGVPEAVVLSPSDARLALAAGGAFSAVDGVTARPVAVERGLPFFAEERPAAEVIFPDNAPQPYRSWSVLQDQRVRYFPQNPPRFTRGGQN
jgi:hypothetical protein